MKKIWFLFIIGILCCVFVSYGNNNPKVIISNLAKRGGDINTGELKYKIYLLGILPIGEAVFGVEKAEEYRGRKVYHLHATAQTSRIFSRIFSGSAVLDSYIDREHFNPVTFRQRLIVSGKNDIDKEITYDQESGVMSLGGVRRQILIDTQDPLSAIFNLRRMNLDKIKAFVMNINSNQKNYILEGKSSWQDIVIGKVTYKIILAKADIRRRDKNPYHKSNITMILVRQKENIPVLIKVFASGVLINAKLIDIK
ncbi:MAG: DUF3108 domain-containing protein [Candidatus Omnitrophica bacterium]|nr:DUF3108 domain-containing protein [Candidatus Omnitrophota bacterium]